MFTKLRRILKFAWTDFLRNKGNNFAAIFVLVIPILLATFLFLFQGIGEKVIYQVEEKIDITAYFKDGVSEDDILSVKEELLNLSSGIKDVQYITKEQALNDFTEKHKNNPDIIAALEEVGGNPFLASLNIKTEDPLQYQKVSDFLTQGTFKGLIDKVDYSQRKDTIDRIFSIISSINKWGIGLGIALFIIAILIVLNTIKLSVDSSKDEIEAMRLVGASNWFIRGPFIFQGAICGFAAFLICLAIAGLVSYIISPKLMILVAGFNLLNYFLGNIGIILLIQIGFGVGLGIVASFILVRSYLKV